MTGGNVVIEDEEAPRALQYALEHAAWAPGSARKRNITRGMTMARTFSGEDLEGRLSAQRRVLQWLLQVVKADSDEIERLVTVLEEPFPPADHQEDPGAVPSEAFASQSAYVAECRLLLNGIQDRLTQDRQVPFAEG